jgi:hypothetical protein
LSQTGNWKRTAAEPSSSWLAPASRPLALLVLLAGLIAMEGTLTLDLHSVKLK